MTAELVIGPIQGHRLWCAKWQENLPVLQSLHRATVWPARGPLRAVCSCRPASLADWIRQRLCRPRPPHSAPDWQCTCGIYAMREPEDWGIPEVTPAAHPRWLRSLGVRVQGVVMLWGRVVQHERGFRAEYARPQFLTSGVRVTIMSRATQREVTFLLDAISRRYGIPVVSCASNPDQMPSERDGRGNPLA